MYSKYNSILSVRLSIEIWGLEVLLFSEFINMAFIFIFVLT